MSSSNSAKTFTEKQWVAIEHERGPAEVISGPGTGKTTVLTERFARLTEKGMAWKYDILLITFTSKDAAEMRERLQLRLGEDVDKLAVFNFHQYGKRILEIEHGSQSDKAFRIYDGPAAYRVLLRAMKEVGADERVWQPEIVMEMIGDAKEKGLGPDEFLTVPDSAGQQVVAKVYYRYQELLNEAGAYEFNDLIMKTINLLETRSDLLAQIHQQHPFIMVDEWQDTSVAQYRLLRLLTGPDANLFVVGSEAQAIYEWRRAKYTRLEDQFCADFPNAKTVVLEDNFRSTTQIVLASRTLFNGHYRDVDLIARRGDGPRVVDARVGDEYAEAVYVANETRRLRDDGVRWQDMAVLYRTNAQSIPLQQEMIRQQVPHQLLQGQRLYNRREVRDMIAYLSIAQNGDEASLGQVINSPPRGLGPHSLRAIQGAELKLTWDHIYQAMLEGEKLGLRPQAVKAVTEFHDLVSDLTARNSMPPQGLMELVIEKSGYRAWLADDLEGASRLASLQDLAREAAEFDTVGEFLAAFKKKMESLAVESDEGPGVTLSTIHTVKGLEFDAVFLVGMEEGILPHVKAKTPEEEEGERRLMYVAMTRARDWLHLISARTREVNGRRRERVPSRYLDLPAGIVERKYL